MDLEKALNEMDFINILPIFDNGGMQINDFDDEYKIIGFDMKSNYKMIIYLRNPQREECASSCIVAKDDNIQGRNLLSSLHASKKIIGMPFNVFIKSNLKFLLDIK